MANIDSYIFPGLAGFLFLVFIIFWAPYWYFKLKYKYIRHWNFSTDKMKILESKISEFQVNEDWRFKISSFDKKLERLRSKAFAHGYKAN